MSIFKLQQFSVKQTLAGMKICSDSLLFGALIPINKSTKRILDIGTGTGILALMQAQKSKALTESSLEKITAVELTQAAAVEAQENFSNSPWSEYLDLVIQAIQQFSKHFKQSAMSHQTVGYDLIMCNPPFFVNQTKTSVDNPLRHAARHSDSLSFTDLCQSIDKLLTDSGRAHLLLPVIAITEFCVAASAAGLGLVERMDIAESPCHPVKVAALTFARDNMLAVHKRASDSDSALTLMIEYKHGRLNKFKQANVHSDDVRDLLSPFLLRYL
ncbi:MAG: tRNA1Val (adenine37-N6)-methyltransferase [Oleispira sp.]